MLNTYPVVCGYYVKRPSTNSHANTTINDHESSAIHFRSPCCSETEVLSRFTTPSRYSSSRGSNNNNSFLHDELPAGEAPQNRLIIVDPHDDDGDGWYYGSSHKCLLICFRIIWKLLLSLGIVLLVYYMASKPPPPKISIKMAGVHQFGLGEGVDGTGVATKTLTCNCSIDLIIDNKSKLFGLHIHPPIIEMSFGRFPFASSHGRKLYAASHGSSLFQLSFGTRNRPMYGAGRNMQDLLASRKGLPLIIRMSFRSNYRVVGDLIKSNFLHRSECFLFLHRNYDKRHATQVYNSTCAVTS
ncbi:Delta-latroinsectotoxin-Lt1a protein [Citrus sinensis]|uniref:Delta-latroinsectotoxin-Lt1a protein n=1 Tax=Citrus sinensis TaxID=2711 RepID=A0ACB8LLY5_CITSI|nr:Delta-latroinsectotoxin-Lt1a protein [Citrus sinensis]